MSIGDRVGATVVVVISGGRIDRHWQVVEDLSKGGKFCGFATCCEVATGDDEIETVVIEDSCQVFTQILRQAAALGGQVHVCDLGEVEVSQRIEGGTDAAKGWHRCTLISGLVCGGQDRRDQPAAVCRDALLRVP